MPTTARASCRRGQQGQNTGLFGRSLRWIRRSGRRGERRRLKNNVQSRRSEATGRCTSRGDTQVTRWASSTSKATPLAAWRLRRCGRSVFGVVRRRFLEQRGTRVLRTERAPISRPNAAGNATARRRQGDRRPRCQRTGENDSGQVGGRWLTGGAQFNATSSASSGFGTTDIRAWHRRQVRDMADQVT